MPWGDNARTLAPGQAVAREIATTQQSPRASKGLPLTRAAMAIWATWRDADTWQRAQIRKGLHVDEVAALVQFEANLKACGSVEYWFEKDAMKPVIGTRLFRDLTIEPARFPDVVRACRPTGPYHERWIENALKKYSAAAVPALNCERDEMTVKQELVTLIDNRRIDLRQPVPKAVKLDLARLVGLSEKTVEAAIANLRSERKIPSPSGSPGQSFGAEVVPAGEPELAAAPAEMESCADPNAAGMEPAAQMESTCASEQGKVAEAQGEAERLQGELREAHEETAAVQAEAEKAHGALRDVQDRHLEVLLQLHDLQEQESQIKAALDLETVDFMEAGLVERVQYALRERGEFSVLIEEAKDTVREMRDARDTLARDLQEAREELRQRVEVAQALDERVPVEAQAPAEFPAPGLPARRGGQAEPLTDYERDLALATASGSMPDLSDVEVTRRAPILSLAADVAALALSR